MAEKVYRQRVGALTGYDTEMGAVVRESDFADLPPGRFEELVKAGAFTPLSAEEAEILATETFTSEREGGEIEDSFADQTRGDALRVSRLLEEVKKERGADREERAALKEQVKQLEDQLAGMKEQLEARQHSQQEETAATRATGGAGAPPVPTPPTLPDTGGRGRNR